jgi:hypothetical protein
MDVMLMAVIAFVLAAIGGLTLAAIRLGGAPWPPLWLALVHGVVAAAGVALLAYAAYTPGIAGLAQAALGIFILAALGGAVLLLGFHLRSKPLPIAFVLGHGLIAATGLVLLLLSYFGVA